LATLPETGVGIKGLIDVIEVEPRFLWLKDSRDSRLRRGPILNDETSSAIAAVNGLWRARDYHTSTLDHEPDGEEHERPRSPGGAAGKKKPPKGGFQGFKQSRKEPAIPPSEAATPAEDQ